MEVSNSGGSSNKKQDLSELHNTKHFKNNLSFDGKRNPGKKVSTVIEGSSLY